MVENFFNRIEADQKLGRRVRSTSNLSSVPIGTEGEVIKVHKVDADHWTVCIEWLITGKYSLIDIGELHFLKKEKYIRNDFTKFEYENLVQELDQ